MLFEALPAAITRADAHGAPPIAHAAKGGHAGAVALLASLGAPVDTALEAALRGEGGIEWGAPARLAAVETLADASGSGMLVWKALRLGAPPSLLAALLASLASAGRLDGDTAYRAGGRALLHTAVLFVLEGRLTDDHALALAAGLPEAELLQTDGEGLTVVGLASERGRPELSLRLEAVILRRLNVLVEIVHAAEHAERARAIAGALHDYWPQAEVRAHAHVAAKSAPRASPFYVVWIERWGGTRSSKVIYTTRAVPHGGGGAGAGGGARGAKGSATAAADDKLPSARTVLRALSLKVNGSLMIM